jgi:uncharacterized protein YoxC
MYTDSFEQFIKSNKNFTGPLNDYYKLMMDLYQHTAQQNLEILSENVSRFSDQLKRLANVHKPEELLNEQRNILSEDVNVAVETLQKVMHTNLESMEEMSKLCGTLCESATFQKGTNKYQGEKSHTEKHR